MIGMRSRIELHDYASRERGLFIKMPRLYLLRRWWRRTWFGRL